jgi:hypothetical protein
MALEFLTATSQKSIKAAYTPPSVDWTLCAWVNFTGWNGSVNGIIGTLDAGNKRREFGILQVGGNARLYVLYPNGATNTYFYANNVIPNLATEYWMCATFVSGGSITGSYINKTVGTMVLGGNSGNLIPASQLTIGMAEIGGAHYLNGLGTDFRVYNRVISTAEANIIYEHRGNDNITNGLVFRGLCNEKPTGTAAAGAGVVIDISGNGNHTTPANNPVYKEFALTLMR